jgi:hypothetical protein
MKHADYTDDSVAELRDTVSLSQDIVRRPPVEGSSLGNLMGAFRDLFDCSAWGILVTQDEHSAPGIFLGDDLPAEPRARCMTEAVGD